MFDIVIPLGVGSLHQDLELKYSLRSMEKNLIGFREIVIIGEKPDWIRNVIHIPMEERGKNTPERIFRKLYEACKDNRLYEWLLYCNDDFFFLKEEYCSFIPYYFQGTLPEMANQCRQKRGYFDSLLNTSDVLIKKGYPNLHYDVHCPVKINRFRFQRIERIYDWSIPNGYVVKSLYCNSLDANISPRGFEDLKINHPLECEDELLSLIHKRWMFSIGDNALANDVLIQWLEKTFPHKSKYEI